MSPSIPVCFEPTHTGDRVRIGQATIDMPLEAIPAGELRELARAGFRSTVLARMASVGAHTPTTNRERVCFEVVQRLVQYLINYSTEDSSDDQAHS